MNGAEALIRTLMAGGVDTCFTNPGTSEMHFVAALDKVPEMRAILCLFEGVATGAADGYARMKGLPACTLLHLGPGLANGLANLHNARRAQTPLVNVVGDHATYHVQLDAPLTSDIKGFAAPVSHWIRSVDSLEELGQDSAEAAAAALSHNGQIATLILPADTAWTEGAQPAPALAPTPPATVEDARISQIADKLKTASAPVFLMSGSTLQGAGFEAAGRLAKKFGARIICDTFNSRLERGAGRVALERLGYFGEQAIEELSGTDLLVVVETAAPVSFFAYPGKPSELTPEGTESVVLASRTENGSQALMNLADLVGATEVGVLNDLARPDLPEGELNAGTAGQAIAALLPEGAIVVDEAATSGFGSYSACETAAPHDWLFLTGGSIGMGLPVATGAAVACPDRKVVCLHGDGGAMYTVQALWTQAREKLDVVNVIFNNRSYAILNYELMRVGAENPGPKALSMLDLRNPELNWVNLGQGLGVSSVRTETAEAFTVALEAALSASGPQLIEVVL